MRLASKTRIVHGALLVLALWPLLQLGLVWQYDLSPWKLAGWGMYTTPRFALVGMEIYGRSATSEEWTQLVAPSPAVRAEGGAFLERHRWLRGLASAERLADVVREQHPEWTELRIAVSYPVLDRGTGMVRLTVDERVVQAFAQERGASRQRTSSPGDADASATAKLAPSRATSSSPAFAPMPSRAPG